MMDYFLFVDAFFPKLYLAFLWQIKQKKCFFIKLAVNANVRCNVDWFDFRRTIAIFYSNFSRSRQTSTIPSTSRNTSGISFANTSGTSFANTSGTSFASSRDPAVSKNKKRTISMGADQRPNKRNLAGSRYRSTDPGKNSRPKPSFTVNSLIEMSKNVE